MENEQDKMEQSELAQKAAVAKREADDAAANASQIEQDAARARQEAETLTQRAAQARAEANRLGAASSTAATVVQTEEDADMVFANVPRTFQLRLDDHSTREIKAGTQRMPRRFAEHWYSKNNGVTIVSDAARATIAGQPRIAGAGPSTELQKEVSQIQAAAGTVQQQPGAPAAGPWPGSPDPMGSDPGKERPAGQPAPIVSADGGSSPAAVNTATSEAQLRAQAEGKSPLAAADLTKAALDDQKSVSDAGAPRDNNGKGSAKGK